MQKLSILNHVNPFLYSQESPWLIRFVAFIGLLTTLLAGFGMLRFLNISIWYWIIFGPIVFLLFYNHILKHAIRILYRNFSQRKHLKFIEDFWQINSEPAIAVFLPYCGEQIEVFSQTVEGSYNMNYENKRIYILDDKGTDPNIQELALKFGAIYLSRPNKGEYKKSGNLQYGWDNSTEEFAIVFDADFVPIPEALRYTVPYIVSDPKMGILQTPQYFEQTIDKHKENEIEFGGGNIVEEFYNLDQVSRDRFDAAICVGTSAIYRRESIMSVGGTPKCDGSEDVRTGLSITKTGYKVKYIPLIISIGTSPDTLQGYFRQHNRWCSGSIRTMVDAYLEAKLSWMQRIIYVMSPVYYISEALVPILLFHFIILFVLNPESLSIYNSLYFIPKLLYQLILMPLVMRNHRTRKGTKLAAMNNIFTYFYTIFIDMPSKSNLLWHPAGVKIQGISAEFRNVVRIGLLFSLLYITTVLGSLIYRREYLLDLNISIMLIWILYSTVSYMVYIIEATKFLKTYDSNYIHPTNSYITKLRRTWATIKHSMIPTSVGILFATVLVNMYFVYSSGTYKLTYIDSIIKNPNISNSQLATIDTSSEPVQPKPTEYTITANVGDGVTQLARKGVEAYIKDNNVTLSAEQKVFVETKLTQQYYKAGLEIGDSISFDTTAIDSVVAEANALTSSQIHSWSRYI